jgi:hypothetical protein
VNAESIITSISLATSDEPMASVVSEHDEIEAAVMAPVSAMTGRSLFISLC